MGPSFVGLVVDSRAWDTPTGEAVRGMARCPLFRSPTIRVPMLLHTTNPNRVRRISSTCRSTLTVWRHNIFLGVTGITLALGATGCDSLLARFRHEPQAPPPTAATRLRAPCAAPDGPGCFSLLPARMLSPRLFFTATVLKDGRVFVAGGATRSGRENRIASTEFFDPATGTFKPGPDMALARSAHTATLLNDGRVLIAGGDEDGTFELFEPKTGRFGGKPEPLKKSREYHSATLLPDGRVILVGGIGGGVPTATHTEVFDPRLNATIQGPRLPGRLWAHGAVIDQRDHLVLVGGLPGLYETLDLDLNALAEQGVDAPFTFLGRMGRGREDLRVGLLRDGRLVATGGSDGASRGSIELWDPQANRWILGPEAMTQRREDHTLTELVDGRFLIVGGEDNEAGPGGADVVLTTGELFDPTSMRFLDLGQLAESRGRDDHQAVRLADGKVLVLGGGDKSGEGLDTASLFDPATVPASLTAQALPVTARQP
jgi:hypothetical protein